MIPGNYDYLLIPFCSQKLTQECLSDNMFLKTPFTVIVSTHLPPLHYSTDLNVDSKTVSVITLSELQQIKLIFSHKISRPEVGNSELIRLLEEVIKDPGSFWQLPILPSLVCSFVFLVKMVTPSAGIISISQISRREKQQRTNSSWSTCVYQEREDFFRDFYLYLIGQDCQPDHFQL